MSLEIILVAILILVSVVLFVTEALRVDLVAMLVMAAVMVLGLVTPQEAFAGFSNPATITIAAMFMLSAGLDRTGTLIPVGNWIAKLIETRGTVISMLALLVVVGFASAIVNNTAAVAIFLPAVMSATRKAKASPSRFLLALSFVSMAGGTITLIGTSTNLLVDGIAEAHGIQGFGMFEFAPLGLLLTAACLVYMLTLGYKLTPVRRSAQDLTEGFRMGRFLSSLSVQPGGQTLRDTIQESNLRTLNTDVLKLSRDHIEQTPAGEVVLEPQDYLTVRTDEPDELEKEGRALGLAVSHHPVTDRDLEDSRTVLVEAGVGSNVEGSTLRAGDVKKSFDAVPLAVQRRGKVLHKGLEDYPLKGGDTIRPAKRFSPS